MSQEERCGLRVGTGINEQTPNNIHRYKVGSVAMRCIVLITATMGLLLASCDDQASQSSKAVNPRIQEAREAIQEMRGLVPDHPSLKLAQRILNEPSFTGVVALWGCLAVFDDDGNLVEAYTMKELDFTTGHKYGMRKYTESELIEARSQVINYKKQLSINENYPIPIFSESMKLAVAETILSENRSPTYTIGRGTRSLDHQLQVTKIQNGGASIVAADALYITATDLP